MHQLITLPSVIIVLNKTSVVPMMLVLNMVASSHLGFQLLGGGLRPAATVVYMRMISREWLLLLLGKKRTAL